MATLNGSWTKALLQQKKIDGSPLKIIGTHTDITSLKEIQNALKQSELQFQSLSENIPGILFLYDFKTDGSHEFSYISPTLEKILGIQAAMFTNLNGVIHPEDVPMLDMQIEDAAKGNSTFSFEGRIVTPEKGILWISLVSSLSYCRTDGTKVYTGIITDITQRKMIEETLRIREEKYRNITANMRLGLLEVDNDEVITFANPSFCEMSGYSEPELLGKNASSLLSGNDELALIQRKNELRKNGHSDAYELTVKDKQGETKWWLISGAPHYNDKGELIGSIGIHLDITKQKKLEFELLEAKLQAEKSAQAKEQFLANMSHEIRTPMNAILGMGHQLQKTSLDGRQLKYLSAINNSAEHLLVIINDILDISKIEAGKLNLEQIGFDFTELVKSAVEVMRLKAEEKGLEIFTTIDKNISQVLIGDPFRIKQVILNHVSNSIKFTEKGSVVIDCKLVEKAGSVETIQLSITDTGIGMDEEFLGDLFTKFSQEDNSIARKYGGTGLGMSISKKLLELMNGKIEVSSKKNKGTCISFTLPLLKGNESSIITKGERSIDTSILKGSRILLVEDNEMNRLVASTVLEHYEVVLVEAENGLEAINILNKERFDLVLMDVQMPVMNGIEATMRIRKEISTTIPIIALTANAIKGESDKCIGAGMNAYVTKPFDEESLIRTIGTLLGKEIKMSVNDNGTNTVEEKLFDLEGLRKLSRGNEAFVIKMVNIFIRTAPESVTEMRSAFDCSEIEKIKSIAHRLKPSIDSLCISSMKAKIREIESFPDHATAAELKGLIDEADQIISSVVVEFRKQFAS